MRRAQNLHFHHRIKIEACRGVVTNIAIVSQTENAFVTLFKSARFNFFFHFFYKLGA